MSESTGVEMLEQALIVLCREAEVAPSRDLSLSITKTEEALMWRQRISLPPQSEAAQAPETVPPP